MIKHGSSASTAVLPPQPEHCYAAFPLFQHIYECTNPARCERVNAELHYLSQSLMSRPRLTKSQEYYTSPSVNTSRLVNIIRLCNLIASPQAAFDSQLPPSVTVLNSKLPYFLRTLVKVTDLCFPYSIRRPNTTGTSAGGRKISRAAGGDRGAAALIRGKNLRRAKRSEHLQRLRQIGRAHV